MTHKAVGLESGRIYTTGTHAECSRYVNSLLNNDEAYRFRFGEYGRKVVLRHTETIRIMRVGVIYRPEDDEKELELLRIRFEEASRAEKEQAEAEKRVKAEQKRKAEKMESISKWTDEQDKQLRALYMQGKHTNVIAMELNERFGTERTQYAVIRRLSALRKMGFVTDRRNRHDNAEEQEAFVEKNHGKMSRNEIAKVLGISRNRVDYIQSKLVKLGRIEAKAHKWTNAEEAYIIANNGEYSVTEMAKWLELTKVQVKSRISKLKLEGRI